MESKENNYFMLTNEEAELLHRDHKCPMRRKVRDRRVWWIKPPSDSNEIIYSICQECYHQNKLGENANVLKEQLIPMISDDIFMYCNAGAENYPFQIKDWKIGIQMILPEKKDLEGTLENDHIYITPSLDEFEYAICLRCNTDEKKPIMFQIFTGDRKKCLTSLSLFHYANRGEIMTSIESIDIVDMDTLENHNVSYTTIPIIYSKPDPKYYNNIIVVVNRVQYKQHPERPLIAFSNVNELDFIELVSIPITFVTTQKKHKDKDITLEI